MQGHIGAGAKVPDISRGEIYVAGVQPIVRTVRMARKQRIHGDAKEVTHKCYPQSQESGV